MFTVPPAIRYKYRELRKVINVGDQVSYTDVYGRVCTGWVKSIGVSTYYTEEQAGILRGYVEVEETRYTDATHPLWHVPAVAGYCLASELTLVRAGYKTFEGEAVE